MSNVRAAVEQPSFKPCRQCEAQPFIETPPPIARRQAIHRMP